MNFLINIVGYPLGIVMKLIYNLVKNYGIAIILFTLVTKLILFPVSYKQQKNSARLQLINPKIAKIRERYKDRPDQVQLETTKLYQEENINPYSSCLTSLIPLIILWGVLAVVYKPMTYIMDYKKDSINEAAAIVQSIYEDEAGDELTEADQKALQRKINNITSESNLRRELILMGDMITYQSEFNAIVEQGYYHVTDEEGNVADKKLSYVTSEFTNDVYAFEKTFNICGVTLRETPSTNPAKNSHIFLFLLPFLSGIVQLIMTIYMQVMQKKRNPAMPSMGAMNIMLYIMPLFSVWLAFNYPAGVGFYWLCSSLFSFLQSILLYAWFNDKRVERIGEIEREKAKKANRRPGMMQMMLEQQQEMMRQQGGQSGAALGGGPSNRVRYSDDDEPKMSRHEQEEYNTAVVRAARARMAEKYGDTEANPDAGSDKKPRKS